MEVEVILYVKDQTRSKEFYNKLLNRHPVLDVPGMTEYQLSENCKLGLMPSEGIAKIFGEQMPHPDTGNGIPRCELYLKVDNIEIEFENAVNCGAKIISIIQDRDWGDKACYFSDIDGHIIAFASSV
jgi:uncharacterized glyoxalase superfamily protein PhnB